MKRYLMLALTAAILGTALSGCIFVPDGGGYGRHYHDDYRRY